MKADHTPRYDLSLNPPYQINYRMKRAGKHITATKRRITFQFGFSSASAIKSGATEVECRGQEHEVVLIWSHMTGKRQLYMDGREIHMSKAARGNTKFEYSWGIPGNHVLKIIANGTPPMGESARAHHKQFDLELDGMSFFTFSKIYELGRRANANAPKAIVSYSYRGLAYDARDDAEEEEEPPMPEVAVDLFDSQQPTSIISPVTQYSSMPSLANTLTSSTSASSYDEFSPVATNQQKSFDSISNEILCAYSSNAPAPSAAESAPSSSRALVPVSEEGMDAITKSMKNLVNLDDITTKPFQPIVASSPSLNAKKTSGNNWGYVGRAPTLSELRDSSSSPTMPTTQQPIMKAPPAQMYQAQPQAMVAYGQQAAAPSYGYQYGAQPNMGYGYAGAY